MAKLDRRHGALRADKIGQPRDVGNEIVVPEAQIADGAATAPLNLGRFDHHQASAACGETADVHQMPIGRKAFNGGVLVHWRDHHAV